LALLCIAIFGAVVFALLGHVYWSTVSYVCSRSDQAITRELASLQKVYASAGRARLISAIAQRLADQRGLQRRARIADDESNSQSRRILTNKLVLGSQIF
jgi:hypothetical protein